ncbi:MAG TPA: proton-conducting transporter membrane subunit [Solirubrobacterales bacterium]|nr:proton-conducting transporter membrane subunit [Solirubrobacterales bacterium]
MSILPLAPVLLLLGATVVAAVGPRRRLATALALLIVLGACGLLLAVLHRAGAGPPVEWVGGWEPRRGIAIGIDFAADDVGAGLALLATALTAVALVMLMRYRLTDPPHLQALLLAFCGGMVGFCLSGDLFNMFVFFELMSVAAFALAGFKVEEDEAVEGSLNFAVTNTIGSFLVLTGIALVYGRTGTLNLAQMGGALEAHSVDGLVVMAFALLAAGFLVKAAVVPFHFWLADAYAVAPTPVCLLFAGAMSELGIYAVARIWFDCFAGALGPEADSLRLVLIVAGSLTALLGAGMCFAQDHLKRLLAFATIAYVGVFLIGLGLLTAEGIAGAAIYVVADGLGKAALFATVAIIQHRRRRVSELALRGKGRALPFTGALLALGALSFAALPPFGTFLGKSMLEDELVATGYGAVIAVLIATSALTAGAVLRVIARVFLGWGPAADRPRATEEETKPEEEGAPDSTPAVMFVPAALLLAAALAIGLIPGTTEAFRTAAERFVDGPAYGRAVLDGVSPTGLATASSYSAPAHSYLYAALGLLGAACAAAISLFVPGGRWLRTPARLLGSAGTALRGLHSGHVGDYVAWLVLGVALLGGSFALALT